MMKLSTVLACCLTLYIGLSEAHVYDPCPTYWTKSGDSCFRFFGQATNWFMAENTCRMFSGCSGGIGHLVSVNSVHENEFLFNYLKSTFGLNPPMRTWVGARRYNNLQRWEWSDGTIMQPGTTYSAWQDPNGQPQRQGRNCLVYGDTGLPTWIDINCQNNEYPYVCEMPADLPQNPKSCSAPVPITQRNFNHAHRHNNIPYGPDVATFRYTKSGNVQQRFISFA